jgi:3-dehydroquinate synthase II
MKRFQFSLDGEEGKIIFSCILQNAETIRLVNNSKDAVSIPDLKLGDKVLVHIGPKATHFGTKIKEKIIEK